MPGALKWGQCATPSLKSLVCGAAEAVCRRYNGCCARPASADNGWRGRSSPPSHASDRLLQLQVRVTTRHFLSTHHCIWCKVYAVNISSQRDAARKHDVAQRYSTSKEQLSQGSLLFWFATCTNLEDLLPLRNHLYKPTRSYLSNWC